MPLAVVLCLGNGSKYGSFNPLCNLGETVGISREGLGQVCRGTTIVCYQGEGIVASEEKILQMQLPEINFWPKMNDDVTVPDFGNPI